MCFFSGSIHLEPGWILIFSVGAQYSHRFMPSQDDEEIRQLSQLSFIILGLAYQVFVRMLQRLSRLTKFNSIPLVCGTPVLTHLFDVEDGGHKC
jgi:hypothetical protein